MKFWHSLEELAIAIAYYGYVVGQIGQYP